MAAVAAAAAAAAEVLIQGAMILESLHVHL